MVFNA
ncbi:Protein of unknown function [Bacillus mycoides]